MINDVTERRVKKGITFSKRIRWAPLPLQTKASLVACLVGPTAMYGFSAGSFALKLISSLRTAAFAALWCTKRKSRRHETALTLFAKSHFVDPLQTAACQSLRQFRRMGEQRTEALRSLSESGAAMRMVEHRIWPEMGWHWQAPALFTRDERPQPSKDCVLSNGEKW